MSLTANPTEVQARALEVGMQAEARREADLIEQIGSPARPKVGTRSPAWRKRWKRSTRGACRSW